MKLIITCKRKKCVPPVNLDIYIDDDWHRRFKCKGPKEKLEICALCKSLKVREV